MTNTLGEMFGVLRFQAEEALRERGVHEFDAWASAFGDTLTELELQPSGTYKPVERFSTFINVPELIAMFRAIADVVLKDDLREHLKLPRIRGGERQLITAPASLAFRPTRSTWPGASRRSNSEGRPSGPETISSSPSSPTVATPPSTCGWSCRATSTNPPTSSTADRQRPSHLGGDRAPSLHGARRHPLSDPGRRPADLLRPRHDHRRGHPRLLGLRWIRQELVRRGVPAAEIQFVQDFKRSAEKQRLFGDFNPGRIRVLIGSSETMGTGSTCSSA